MFRNHLKSAFTALFANISVSLIKITGLSLGISVCLVIITIINDQRSFDKFHKDRERIYRVNTRVLQKNGETSRYASTTYPLAELLKEKSPNIEYILRLTSGLNGQATAAGKKLYVN